MRYRETVIESTAGPLSSSVVAELNEEQLLARILPRLRGAEEVLLGAGDDAAVLAVPDGRVVVSVDTLVQERDFRLLWANGYASSGRDIGWKAAAQNLSDINAMGAEATGMVVSLSLPGWLPIAWVEDFATGIQDALDALGASRCAVVGGDLSRGREIVAGVTVFGDLAGAAPLLRSTAAPGERLALAGEPGRAAAGLAILESRHRLEELVAEQRVMVDSFRTPRPLLAAGPAAARAGAGAMLDVSDGLLRDAARLARASGVALDVDENALRGYLPPLRSAAQLLKVEPMDWVLGGGEDYGLLATFGPGAALPDGFRVIGSVVSREQSQGWVCVSGRPFKTVGWDHFAH